MFDIVKNEVGIQMKRLLFKTSQLLFLLCILSYAIITNDIVVQAEGLTDNPGYPYPVPTTTLGSGSSGDMVRWVQKFANDVMGAGITIDGVYGTQTINAVKTFQQQNGLTADGIVGTDTVSTMLAVWKAKVTPVDVGSGFAAIIIRTDIWKSIKNDNANVVLWDELPNARYYWYFTRQSDGSYIIQSLYDSKVLDVCESGTTNGTNVQTCGAWGTDNGAQKWFVYSSGSSYKFIPKCASNMCLEAAGAGTTNGTNIQLYQDNGTVAQQFSIYKISHAALQSISITSDYASNMCVGDTQTLKFNVYPSETKCNTVKWSSSDTNVISVNNEGVLTAKKVGTATITCTSTFDASITSSVTINVTNEDGYMYQVLDNGTPDDTSDDTIEITRYIGSATELKIPSVIDGKRVTSIGEWSILNCSSLISIEIPDGVTSIGEHAINMCSALTSVKIPNSVTSIGGYVFWGCHNLTSIEIPNSVTRIGERAFSVSGITNIKIPDSVTSFGISTFSACTKLTSVVLPSNITCIVEVMFGGCTSLTSIEIPDSVTIISEKAFYNCSSLTSIKIPQEVTSIGNEAFYGCSSLTSIEIPSGVTSIGENVFDGCSDNLAIYVAKDSYAERYLINNGISYEYVKDDEEEPTSESTETQVATTEIPKHETPTNGDNPSEATTETTTTGSNTTPITNGSQVTVSKVNYTVTDTKKKTVTYMMNSNTKLTSITIPATVKIKGKKYKVTKIADNAFKNNKKLKKVKIGSNITSIGKNAFKGCTNLQKVTLGKNVKKIGNSAFEGCKKIKSIKLTKNITTLGNKVFYNCKKLKTVTVETPKLKKVGKKAFAKIANKPNLQFISSVPASKRKKILKLLKR